MCLKIGSAAPPSVSKLPVETALKELRGQTDLALSFSGDGQSASSDLRDLSALRIGKSRSQACPPFRQVITDLKNGFPPGVKRSAP
jgi:hypothetical protein